MEPSPSPDSGTWHYGLIARWWAEVNTPDPAELAYLRGAVARFGEPALDLGCGTGRLLVPLLADGLDVDGTDISADMVDLAGSAAARAAIDTAGRLAVQAFDELDLPRRYGTIFSIGSFAIGGSRDRDERALRRIHEQLRPGGAVVLSLEVLTPEGEARLADPDRVYPSPWPATGTRGRLADGDDLELLGRTFAYDTATRCQTMDMRSRLWRGDRLLAEEEGRLRCTYYEPDDLQGMISAAGFVDVVVEGPYTRRPPEPADDTIVVVARRVS